MEAKDTVIQLKALPKQIFEGTEDTRATKVAYVAGWKDGTERQAEISFKAGEDQGYKNGSIDGYNTAKQEALKSHLEGLSAGRKAGIKEVVEWINSREKMGNEIDGGTTMTGTPYPPKNCRITFREPFPRRDLHDGKRKYYIEVALDGHLQQIRIARLAQLRFIDDLIAQDGQILNAVVQCTEGVFRLVSHSPQADFLKEVSKCTH